MDRKKNRYTRLSDAELRRRAEASPREPGGVNMHPLMHEYEFAVAGPDGVVEVRTVWDYNAYDAWNLTGEVVSRLHPAGSTVVGELRRRG